MPPGLQKVMTETSFFDILVDIFIHRKLSKMVIAIVSPFLHAKTPDEVKSILKEEGKIPANVYRGLFRKVSQSNLHLSVCHNLGYHEQLFNENAIVTETFKGACSCLEATQRSPFNDQAHSGRGEARPHLLELRQRPAVCRTRIFPR